MKLNLHKMTTETRNQSTWNLDTMTPLEVVTAMNVAFAWRIFLNSGRVTKKNVTFYPFAGC